MHRHHRHSSPLFAWPGHRHSSSLLTGHAVSMPVRLGSFAELVRLSLGLPSSSAIVCPSLAFVNVVIVVNYWPPFRPSSRPLMLSWLNHTCHCHHCSSFHTSTVAALVIRFPTTSYHHTTRDISTSPESVILRTIGARAVHAHYAVSSPEHVLMLGERGRP